jgi:hypothetical protein
MISRKRTDASTPRRPIEWRSRRARYLADTRRRPSRHDDSVVAELANLYRCCDDARSGRHATLGPIDRDMECAVDIFEETDGLGRALLEARLLGDESLEHIAAAQGITLEAVAWYSAAFFDVIDRLDDTDYVIGTVIGPCPSEARGNARIGWCWRQAAYLGGASELAELLATDSRTAEDKQRSWSSRLAAAQQGMLRQFMTAASTSIDPHDVRVGAQLVQAHLRKALAEGTDNAQLAKLLESLEIMFSKFPLRVGGRGDHDAGPLAPYDRAGIELSAEERILMLRGEIPDSVPALDGMPFPELPSASNTGIPS